MAKQAPDITVANNSHCFIHCGAVGPESEDEGRDLTIMTSANNHVVYAKNGSKVEHIQGASYETCGHEIDPAQKEAVAKAICVKNGDLVLNAERGNIRLKAKNIYFESKGGKGEGNFLVSSNGYIILASTEEVRLAGSKICINGTAGINVVSGNFINMSGEIQKFGPVSAISTIKSLLAGNWGSLIEGMTNSCGKTGVA